MAQIEMVGSVITAGTLAATLNGKWAISGAAVGKGTLGSRAKLRVFEDSGGILGEGFFNDDMGVGLPMDVSTLGDGKVPVWDEPTRRAKWDPQTGTGGGGTESFFIDMHNRNNLTQSSSGFAFKGVFITTDGTVEVHSVLCAFDHVNGAIYKAIIAAVNGSNVIQSIIASPTYTAVATQTDQLRHFPVTPTLLAAGKYAIMIGRTDSTNTFIFPIRGGNGVGIRWLIPGITDPALGQATLAQNTPAVGQTISELAARSDWSVGLKVVLS